MSALANNLYLKSFSAKNLKFLGVNNLNFNDVKGKKTKAGAATRNQAGLPPKPKLGLKVYDGQRVPKGTELMRQKTIQVMPGWNVSQNVVKMGP